MRNTMNTNTLPTANRENGENLQQSKLYGHISDHFISSKLATIMMDKGTKEQTAK